MQTINNFLQNYRQGRIVLTSRVSYNTRDLIEDLVRLRNAQFVDPTFADGTPKIFYNVGWAMSDNIYKHTLIGAKDIQLHSSNRKGSKIISLIKMATRSYLKRTMFGEISDEMRKELIDMGHVVVKVVNGEPYTVDLLNIICPPELESLQDGSLVEQIQMSYEQMLQRKEDWKEHWEDIESLWEYMQQAGRSYFTVYEYWCRDDFDGDGKIVKGCKTYLDRTYMPQDMVKDPMIWAPYLELDSYKSPYTKKIRSKKKQKDLGSNEELIYPYVEKRLFKLKGRWLGLGIYELIKGILEHINTNWNLKRKFDELQYRGIMVHKQPTLGDQRTLTQEFLESLPSGAVIDVVGDEDLRRLELGTITMDNLRTNDSLLQLMKLILGVAEQIAGENLKTNVTATAINANTRLSETTYGIVIRQMSFLLRELFQDFLLKELIEEMTMEDWLEVTGDAKEILELEQPLIDNYVNQKTKEAMDKGVFLTEQDIDTFAQAIQQDLQSTGSVRWAQISKKLVDSLDLLVEFYIDGENFDAQARLQNIEAMLNRQNLTLNREELEKEEVELMGLDSKKLEKTQAQKQAEAQQAQQMAMQQGQPKQ